MREHLTEIEFYKLQSIKAREALASERIEGTKQESKLLDAVGFMATIAKTATIERSNASKRALQATNTEIQNELLELGVMRHAPGGIADWSVEIGDSPETSFFNAEDIS